MGTTPIHPSFWTRIDWHTTLSMVLNPWEIQGLNHAYGTRALYAKRRRKGRRRGLVTQRFLTPEAQAYKDKWRRLFEIEDLVWEVLWKYHDEPDPPKLALSFTFLYTDEYWYDEEREKWRKVRVNTHDLTNLFKLIEDALVEYIGIDDKHTVRVIGEKVYSPNHRTQILLSVGHARGGDLIDEWGHLTDEATNVGCLIEKDWSTMTEVARPPLITAYLSLPKDKQEAIDKIVLEHVVDGASETSQAMKAALEEFGDDAGMLLTAVRSMTKKQLLKPDLWKQLVTLMERDPSTITTPAAPDSDKAPRAPRAPRQPRADEPNPRGKLPFRSLPKLYETAESFNARWLKDVGTPEAVKEAQWPADMIDTTTGQINWDCKDGIYWKYKDHQVVVYRALLEGKKTYEDLQKLTVDGKPISSDALDKELKRYAAREPSWLPPGAGTYHEDPLTGQMWIERDAKDGLEKTKPFMEVKRA